MIKDIEDDHDHDIRSYYTIASVCEGNIFFASASLKDGVVFGASFNFSNFLVSSFPNRDDTLPK